MPNSQSNAERVAVTGQRPLYPRWLNAFVMAALLLALGLSVSYTLWRSAVAKVEQAAHAHLDASASLALSAIERRLEQYRAQLTGMQALFVVQAKPSHAQFRRYFELMNRSARTPGVRAVHFTRYVTEAELPAFVASVRNDKSLDQAGFPGFTVHPTASRDAHFVIEMIEPLQDNLAAFGLDAASQPVNRAAFLAARDSQRSTLTAPFQLVQSAPGELGVVMRAGVYRVAMPLTTLAQRRSAFIGLVGISLETSVMFKDIFAESYLTGLRLTVHDISADHNHASKPALRQLIADNGSTTDSSPTRQSEFTSLTIISVGERLWEISLRPNSGWLAWQYENANSHLIWQTGAAISALLALLYLALARARTRAVKLANKMTLELRQSEQQARQTSGVLQATLDHMAQGISVVDAQLQMTAMNSRFGEILGFPESLTRATTSFETFARFNAERGEYGACDVASKVHQLVAQAKTMQPHHFKRTRPNGVTVELCAGGKCLTGAPSSAPVPTA